MTDTSQTPNILDDVLNNFKTSVNNVVAFGNKIGQAVIGDSDSVSANTATADQAAKTQQSAIATEGQASQDINTITQNAAIKQKNDDAMVAQSGGVDPVAQAAHAKELMDLSDSIWQKNKQLDTAAGHTLWNDPLDWVVDQFTTPTIQGQRDAEVKQFQDRSGQLKAIQDSTKDSFAMNAALDSAASTDLTKAQNTVLAAQTIQKQQQSVIDAAKFDNQAMQTIASIDSLSFDQNYKLADLQFKVNEAARSDAIANVSIPGKTEQDEIRKNTIDTIQAQKDSISKFNSATGLNLTPGALKGLPTTQNAATENLINALSVSNSYGFTPFDSYSNTTRAGVVPVSGAEGITKNFIGQSIAAISNSLQWKQMSPENQKQAVNNNIQARTNQELQNIPTVGGLYSPPPLASALKVPTVMATDIGKAMVPLANPGGQPNPDYPIKMQDVYATSKQLITDGKLDPGAAAQQISQIAKAVQMQTNGAKMFDKWAIKPLDTDTGYKQAVTVTSPFSGTDTKVIDWTSPAQVESLLTRDLSNSKFQKSNPGPTTLSPFAGFYPGG